MAERVGQFLGNYQLLRLLGRGAFAEVYLAEHRYLEVPAAIKILHVRMEQDTLEQFLREARTIAHLQHAHIVRVLDFGFQDQTPYLVMEYTPNGTLRTRHPKGTRLPLDLIIRYLKQIASALDYAHQQRVIHRDVKPENMLLKANDEVVLSDFGLAVVQRSLDSLPSQHQAGTPIYMAPEQIRGKPTAASDQYALGVLVYEWLCGEPPFRGSLFEVLSQHLHEPPPSLCARIPAFPLAVEDAVFGALAKEPHARFASLQDFADVLEDVCDATQPLLLGLLSEGFSREQISPYDTLPAPLQTLSQKAEDRSSSARQPLVLAHQRTEETEELVELEVPTPTTQTPAFSQHERVSVSRTNRQRLIRKVRAYWIAGVLEHSLHGAALLALGLQEQPDAIANPWQLMLQHPAGTPRPLPADTRIKEVYDAAEGEMLILGAPGSGKTTLLLELARDLLERAEHDEQHPLPVVFNLSSWASKQQGLAGWLVEELNSTYQVPRALGQAWVDADQILPLLDGLDEVAPKDRTRCIEAINSYRGEHGLLPLVVCSRSTDYLAQTVRVRLGSAVMVQPLTEQQVDAYLASGGEPLRALRVALSQDAGLRELMSTPLMLSILTLTYHDVPAEELLRQISQEDRQRQIFACYVERMLRHRGAAIRYSHAQTTHWLAWLARQMKQHNQTIFYIEHLQPDWLSGDRMRRAYNRWAIRFPAILMGVLVSLPFNSFIAAAPLVSYTSLVLTIVLGGFIGWLLSGGSTKLQSRESGTGPHLIGQLRTGAFIGLGAGLLTGLSAGLFGWLSYRVFIGLLTGLSNGLNFGLGFGLSGGLLSGLLTGKPVGISLADKLIWSWRSLGRSLLAKRHLYTALCVMAFSGLLLGLNYGLTYGLMGGLGYGLVVGPSNGLVIGLGFWLALGLLQGVSSETLGDQRRVIPNQGIRRSARNGLVFGLISIGIVLLSFVLIGGVISWLIFGLIGGVSFTVSGISFDELKFVQNGGPFGEPSTGLNPLLVALGFVLCAGVLVGLLNGGLACLRHSVIRLLLQRVGSIPWNYPRFLESAAERILLRKVGGGYIFVHRSLLEYFASLESTPTPGSARAHEQHVLPVS